ncbi:oxidative stress-responsive serine-rich protein 1 [Cyprinodon tularosa]|uniref:oxidative stress-responsive serine-rich protein 1 n=1 Tax=Cyprinodon tularosa TaxID=77115 RepID=UPI0018E25AB2|nr:oxidative stress-responsive serine-rich protein 1 [Cyprinodon tularosa]
MEAGGKDCEEETLQTAFKKLRVDAESLSGAVSVSDSLAPRAASRVVLDGSSGAKAKLSCSKETWHCCTRKTSRGTSSRTRRRRSKSPILHPPRFTYCSSAASALAPPGGCLKQQRLALSESAEPQAAVDESPGSSAGPPVQTERCSSGLLGRGSPVIFGVRPSYDTRMGGMGSSPSLPQITTAAKSPRWEGRSSREARSSEESGTDNGSPDRAGASAPLGSNTADFRALSELHSRSSSDGPLAPCSCCQGSESEPREESQPETRQRCHCRSHAPGWKDVEVYSFTGLRSVISECEGSLSVQEEESRTLSSTSSSSPLSSGSPRSCSEQARAYVDDITIEDLSGYMEYYLYIPKKMSHMAEMMYT